MTPRIERNNFKFDVNRSSIQSLVPSIKFWKRKNELYFDCGSISPSRKGSINGSPSSEVNSNLLLRDIPSKIKANCQRNQPDAESE
jgi:hypothetical protein